LPPETLEKLLRILLTDVYTTSPLMKANLGGISVEARLEGLSEEQIRQYLDKITTVRKPTTRKQRRKK
jgi:hypothetical protein